MDHIVKHCPLVKEEQEAETPKKQFRKQGGQSSGKRFTRAMLAAWGDSTDEEEESGAEEAVVALMARSEADSEEETTDSLIHLKNKVSRLNKTKLKEFLFTLMDECDALHSENCELRDECDELKEKIKELKHDNKTLKDEKIELDMDHLVLHENLVSAKETFKLREETFVTNLAKLEEEVLELKRKIESLLGKNQSLHDQLEQARKEQAENRQWHNSSKALIWLNTHHNHGRKGLGFEKKYTVYPCNRNYVGLPENIVCYHCGKIGHVRYSCLSRKHALERNFGYVRQIWIKKDELAVLKGMGPKKIWVPKSNN
jgi:hypothetical protein